MVDPKKLGSEGEERAAGYLVEKGFKILERNWTRGKTEIDIIAKGEGFIVFVEVKTRTEGFFDEPVNAVTRNKQRSIIFAAEGYMKRLGYDIECRFDVITIVLKKTDFLIEHIPDAFYPTLR